MAEQSEQDRQIDEAFRGLQALLDTYAAAQNSITHNLALMGNLMQLMQERYTALQGMLRAREAERE